MIIGVTGFFASGKDTVADYLTERHGFAHLSLSDMIRDRLRQEGREVTIDHLTEMGNRIRRDEGAGALGQMAVDAMAPQDRYVVTSIRHPAELEALRQRPPCLMFFVDAPIALRYQRSVRRGRGDDTMTFEEFAAAEARQMSTRDSSAQNLAACKDMADHVLINDRDLDALYGQVEEWLNEFCPDVFGAPERKE